MSHEPSTWQLERSIGSCRGAGGAILHEVLAQLRSSHWHEHEVFGVHLALEEALVNAIEHGNCADVSKQVHVRCRMTPDRIWIEIRDEGPGFDPDKVPDCTTPENIMRDCGRGLMLMRAYMTRVEYNDLGNCVVMEKVRNGLCGEPRESA